MENVLRLLSTSKAFDGRWGISRVSGPTRYFLARLLLEYGAAPIRCRQPDFAGHCSSRRERTSATRE